MGYENVKFPEGSIFLVTGGAGFIGSNLCEAILKLGYKVRCLDDLSTGKQENVDLFLDNPNYTFIKGDIKDLDICMKACEGVDYVLHQAAWGSVPRSIEMPLFYCANNITGTLNMMEAARQCGVKKFVYASSSSVYGDEPNLPKKEGIEGNLYHLMLSARERMKNGQSSIRNTTDWTLMVCAILMYSVAVRIRMEHMLRLFQSLSSSLWRVSNRPLMAMVSRVGTLLISRM